MDEQVYNRYYDTGGNYHWIGVHSGEHIVRKGERMTREEAITKLKIYRDYLCKMSSVVDVNEVAKPFNMAIEALEHKYGEWQVYYDGDSPQDGIWKCSICGYIRLIDDISPTNFCPNCGAKMNDREEKKEE